MDSGSIEEVTKRLKSWCILHDQGLARVEWDSAYARQEVVNRLKDSLGGAGIPLVEISLPPGQAAHETVTRLIEKLQSRSGSAVSITDIEWAFPENGNRLDTLAALSFQRETLASLPVRQIWWIPSSLTEQFILGIPDLDSWFRLRLHLTESPPQPAGRAREMERIERKTVSVAESRSIARRYWERLEAARAQNFPEERIWAELAQPAVDSLRSAGLELEADSILMSLPDARGRLERELDELRATRGPEDPELLLLTGRLSGLLRDQGDLAGARLLQERVVEVWTRVLSEEHPATLTLMNNLAETLREQGDHVGARRLQERVLEVRTRVLGEEHPDTLASMANLAATLAVQGDLAGARQLEEQVLEATTRVRGEEHPDTLRSMNNLADTLDAQGDHAGARRLLDRVLEASRRVLGEEHPNTLRSMGNLASALGAHGDLDGARRLEDRVLQVMTRVLGEEHPDTLTAINNLASTLWSQGDHEGARRLYERVLGVRTRVMGEEHPKTLASMGNLAETLWAQGDLKGALPLLCKCLSGRRKVLGEDHPATVAIAESLRRLETELQAKPPSGQPRS